MRIVVIEHDNIAPAGLFAAHLPPDVATVRPTLGEPLPDPTDYDGVVVLGGIMGAYDEVDHPFLIAEKQMLRDAVAAGVPVLGICLGCQLLAAALGGNAYLAPRIELRFAPCELTPAGQADPVARHLGAPVLSFHQDTWDLPPGAVLLATSPEYPQAFRLGSAVGIQPHPEVTPEIVAGWIDAFDEERLAAVDTDLVAVLDAMAEGREASAATADRLFSAWLASLE